jgi:hypothetical protein
VDPLGSDGKNTIQGISSDFGSFQGHCCCRPKQLLSRTSVVSMFHLFRTGNNASFPTSSCYDFKLSLELVSSFIK